MRVWRLVPRAWAASAMSGEGARIAGGRWNSPGTAVVYLSSSLSLAALEVLVHADPDDLPDPYAALPVDVPEDPALIETVDPSALDASWRSATPPPALQAHGDAWVREARTLLLAFPSVIVPEERNFALNPAHPAMTRVRVGSPQPFHFDRRLLGP